MRIAFLVDTILLQKSGSYYWEIKIYQNITFPFTLPGYTDTMHDKTLRSKPCRRQPGFGGCRLCQTVYILLAI